MGTRITALDFSLIQSAVERMRQSYNTNRASEAFLYLVLDAIYPNIEQDINEIITEGQGDRGIDAIYIRDNGQDVQIDMISAKYRESPRTCEKNFEGNEVQKIKSFISDIFAKSDALLASANVAVRQKCNDIWTIFASGRICHFRIILISNGLPLSDEDRDHFSHFCLGYDKVKFEEVDSSIIVKLLSDTTFRAEEAKLKAVDLQIFDRSDGDVRGVIANIDVNSLLDAITDRQTRSIKRYLFNDNIRVYLGDDGGYNKDIISTALSDDNYLFWYMNNGITIICERVEYQKGTRNPVITITNFQIVNGAQTCNALFNAMVVDSNKIGALLLLVKIFETHRKDVSQKVAIATNSQARINQRDLHSNDDVQKKIEHLLFSHGYYYERKKNQYLDKPANVRIDALKLGQMILSYTLGEPDKAKTESDSIFGHKYLSIFHERYSALFLVSIIRVYEDIERRRDELRLEQRRALIDTEESRFLNYGHWHILFTVSLIAQKDGLEIPHETDMKRIVDEAIEIVARAAGEYKTVAHYDMFRSPRFRQRLVAEFGSTQLALPL